MTLFWRAADWHLHIHDDADNQELLEELLKDDDVILLYVDDELVKNWGNVPLWPLKDWYENKDDCHEKFRAWQEANPDHPWSTPDLDLSKH